MTLKPGQLYRFTGFNASKFKYKNADVVCFDDEVHIELFKNNDPHMKLFTDSAYATDPNNWNDHEYHLDVGDTILIVGSQDRNGYTEYELNDKPLRFFMWDIIINGMQAWMYDQDIIGFDAFELIE